MGLSKTGTTNLQVFFHRNPEALAAAGIHYPNVWTGISEHALLTPTVLRPNAGGQAYHLALALEIRSKLATASGPIETPLWSNAFRLIDESAAHTAILSYENFYEQPEYYCFDAVAERLSAFDVTGVIYLRTQEDWATSLYAQSIRGPARLAASFGKYIAPRRDRLDFSIVLDRICAHVPLDHLVVGDYDAAAPTGLLDDFLQKAGLPSELAQFADDEKGRNSSLPIWASLYLLRCNRAGIPDEAFVDVAKALTKVDRQKRGPIFAPGLDVATPEERQALRDIAAADAERLKARYGITLTAADRELGPYRPFDDGDVAAITEVVRPRVSDATQEALDRL